MLYPFPAQSRRSRPLDPDSGRRPSWGIYSQELAHRHDAGLLWQRSWGISQISSLQDNPGRKRSIVTAVGLHWVAGWWVALQCRLPGPGNSNLLWWESCLFSEAKFRVNKMQGLIQTWAGWFHQLFFSLSLKSFLKTNFIIVASHHCRLRG